MSRTGDDDEFIERVNPIKQRREREWEEFFEITQHLVNKRASEMWELGEEESEMIIALWGSIRVESFITYEAADDESLNNLLGHEKVKKKSQIKIKIIKYYSMVKKVAINSTK